MQEYHRLSEARNVDPEAECLYRIHHGAGDRFYPHTHEFYEIFLTVTGTVTHEINGIIQNLPEGRLVFIRPDDCHGYRYDTEESRHTVYANLAFSKRTAELLFAYLSPDFPSRALLEAPMPPYVDLDPAQKEQLLARIEALQLIRWQDKRALKMQMRALLADVFVRYFSSPPPQAEVAMPAWLFALLAEMERPENFAEGTERMVVLSGRSREHVARCVKKYCGVSCATYVNGLRLSYASNLLSYTDKSILDICFQCGFQSVSHFYRVFRACYGMSPRELRVGRRV